MLSKEKVLKRIEEEIESAYKKPMLATDHLWCLHYAIAVMKEDDEEKEGDEKIEIPIGCWYADTDKRKPNEEMIYRKLDSDEEYMWKDDMWVRIK